MTHFFTSLKSTLLAAFVLLSVAAIGLMSAAGIWFELRASQTMLLKELVSDVELNTQAIHNWLHERLYDMRVIVSSPFDKTHLNDVCGEARSAETAETFLSRLAVELVPKGHFAELFLINRDGEVTLSTNAENIGKNHKHQSHFQEGRQSPFISGIFYNVSQKTHQLIITVPAQDDAGQFLGLLAGRLEVSELTKFMLTRHDSTKTGEAYLVSNDRQFITGLRFQPASTFAYSEGIDRALTPGPDRNGQGIYKNYNGIRVVGAYRWFPELRAVFLSERTEQEALAGVRQFAAMNIGIALVMILVAVGSARVITARITDPVRALTDVATSLADGNLEQTVTIASHNEIGVLADAFNVMTQRLRGAMAALQEERNLLRTLIDLLPDFIYVKNTRSQYLVLNQAVMTSFGLHSSAEIVGKTDLDFLPADLAQQFMNDEQTIIRTEEAIMNKEEHARNHLTGEPLWLLTTKVPFRNRHGEIAGIAGISRNITELKHIQRRLQLLNEELEQRVKARTAELEQANAEIRSLNAQLKQENLRMSAELEVSRRIQQMILPSSDELKHIPGLEVVGFMQPADEIGGDYYDVLHSNDILHVGIGDVTGHGLESGILMLMTQTAIRTLIEHGETDPVIFLDTLNRTVYKNIQRMNMNKTLTLAFVNYQNGIVKIIGQHEEMLVVRQGGKVERVDTVDLGFPLGLEEHIAQFVAERIVTLHSGKSVVLYTDGITEAENAQKMLYGIERLCRVISCHWNESAEMIKQAIVEDVTGFIGQQTVYDDLTLVVLKQQ